MDTVDIVSRGGGLSTSTMALFRETDAAVEFAVEFMVHETMKFLNMHKNRHIFALRPLQYLQKYS